MEAPANAFEQQLASLGYEPLPPFVILDEHAHQRSDGRGVEVFDRPRLERLARKLNGKVTYQNQALPVIVGHTTPGTPEEKLPGIRGWCTRYQVGDFYDEHGNKKAAIYAKPWAAPGERTTFQKFPHRSIELWTGGETGDDIHPLALLGPTAPRRNLGVHLFSRDQTPGRYHYSRGVDMNQDFSFLGGAPAQAQPPAATGSTAGQTVGNMTVDQLAGALAPALATTKEFSGLFQMRDEVAQMLDNEAQEWEPGGFDQQGMMGGGMMGGMDPSMMGGQMAMAGGGGMYGGDDQYPQQFSRAPFNPYTQDYYQAQQFARQAGYPTPYPQARRAAGPPRQPQRFSREHLHQHAPSTIPTQYVPPEGSKLEQVPIPELPPGDPYKAQFDRLTALIAPLVAKVAEQEKATTIGAVIDRDLQTLATQHRVKFDFAREKQHLLALPTDEARKEHFQRMQENYARLGVADMPQLPAAFPVGGPQQVATPLPAPQHGHALTVGAMLPGQPGAPVPTLFSRGATGLGGERAYDEAAIPQGLDAFSLAVHAQQAKQPVASYLQQLRNPPAANGNGAVEKVR